MSTTDPNLPPAPTESAPAPAAPSPTTTTEQPAGSDETSALRARIAELEAQQQRAVVTAPSAAVTGPWDEAAKNAGDEHQAPDPLPYTGPGAVTHSHPILSFGAAGQPVLDLVTLLAVLGYRENSIIKGANAYAVLDDTVMGDVRRFLADHDVAEAPSAFAGQAVPARDLVGNHVGPYIWQALEDAAEAKTDTEK